MDLKIHANNYAQSCQYGVIKMKIELTEKERRAISALEKVAKIWPGSLWLFSAGGNLHVMQKDWSGECVFKGEGVDQGYSVATINIENDGGDW